MEYEPRNKRSFWESLLVLKAIFGQRDRLPSELYEQAEEMARDLGLTAETIAGISKEEIFQNLDRIDNLNE